MLSPEQQLDHALVRSKVVELRTQGYRAPEIANHLGLDQTTVNRHIKAAVEEFHKDITDVIRERTQTHDDRCEDLYSRIHAEIRHDPEFDPDKYRLAIAILERQSKLLGLDKAKVPGDNKNRQDWLAEATPAELEAEALRMGIPVPQKFITMGTNKS